METQSDSRRRRLGRATVVIILLSLLFLGLGGYWLWSRPTFDLVQLPRNENFRAWPLDKFWQWNVRLPPLKGDEFVQLRLHSRSQEIPKGRPDTSIIGGTKPVLTPKTSEESVDAGYFSNRPGEPEVREVQVAFQLISPPAGSSATQPVSPIQIQGSMSYRSATSFLTPTETLPLQGTIERWSTESDINWTSNTLLLARFWMKQNDRRRLYELVVVRHDPHRWPMMKERDE